MLYARGGVCVLIYLSDSVCVGRRNLDGAAANGQRQQRAASAASCRVGDNSVTPLL
jgi:hypothetical protein